MSKVTNLVSKLRKDQDGAALIEYTVLLGILIVAVIATITLVGTWVPVSGPRCRPRCRPNTNCRCSRDLTPALSEQMRSSVATAFAFRARKQKPLLLARLSQSRATAGHVPPKFPVARSPSWLARHFVFGENIRA